MTGVQTCALPISPSDTTGEKDFEEFFTEFETLNIERFQNLGIIKNNAVYDRQKIEYFSKTIQAMKSKGKWTKNEIVELFFDMIPNFAYMEKGKYLDAKM